MISNPQSQIPNPQSVDLFVYGTLMQERIRRQLLGRAVTSAAATLFGFRRIEPANSYPFVVRSADDRVEGLLLRGFSAGEIAVLDAYEDEGRLYLRERVTVRVGAIDHGACVYVGVPAALRRVRRSHFDHNREVIRQRI